MRRSNLGRRPRGNVETKYFPLKGGLNLVDSPMTIPPGMCLAATNYECLTTDGYRRSDGFERADGQGKPSDASYWILNYDIGSAAINVDDVVVGASSTEQGKVLLDVPGATNLLSRSEQFDHTDWTNLNTTETPDTTTAPDGTLTADTLIDDAVMGSHRIGQSVTLVGDATYQLSCHVKAGTFDHAYILVKDNSQWVVSESAVFDLTTATIFSQTVGANPTITQLPDNWFRISIQAIAISAPTTGGLWVGIHNGSTNSYSGSGDTIIVWGAQMEASTILGKYTRTITAGTRGGYLVLTQVTGSFTEDEDLEVLAVKKAEVDGEATSRAASTPTLNDTYLQNAIETQRALILKLGDSDGSGGVTGVHMFNGDLYGFRDNASVDKTLMWKATSSGWVQQALGNRIHFTDAGAGVEYVESEVITGTVSGASATINRVVLQSGAWGTDAVGYFIIGNVTAGPFQAEAATGSVAGAVPIDAAEIANTIADGGRFEFENDNFFGSSFTQRMYGVSGVDYAFEWDGTIFVPIITGNIVDTPHHLEINEFHLMLAFANGSLQNSDTGKPYVWTGGGAAEIGCGDDIVGLKKEIGGAMIILCKDRTLALHGKNTMASPWDLKPVTVESGGIEWSMQRIGRTRFMDDRGFMSLQAVQDFGDFLSSTYSQVIQPIIDAKKTLVTESIIVKKKSQLRTYFSDGTGIIATFKDNKISGFTVANYKNASGSSIPVICATNGEDSDGAEIMYFGSSDGYVYQLDQGTSFDGSPVDATFVLVYNNLRSPSHNKQFKKVVIETDGSEGTVIKYNVTLDYSSGKSPTGITVEETMAAAGAFWNSVIWNAFSWASEDVTLIEGGLDGVGRNIGLQISSSSTYNEPHTLFGLTYHYIFRKLVR